MRCLYRNLLEPELYSDKRVAQFIDNLTEPEIDTASDIELETFVKNMVPTDDIAGYLQKVLMEAQTDFQACRTVSPSFFAFYNDKRKPLRLLSDNPGTQSRVDNLLSAGKCLALTTTANAIFFRSMVYHEDSRILIDKSKAKNPQLGIHVVGSSVQGNCFVSLVDIQSTRFVSEFQKITREGSYNYPFGQFFHIKDDEEMNQIVRQIEKIAFRVNLSPEECLINFATTLKALLHFGYSEG